MDFLFNVPEYMICRLLFVGELNLAGHDAVGKKVNSPLYLFPPALAFCFGTVFHVFLNMENA